ncbi:MAG TPA: glycine cleavage system protein GcvH [Chloroflexota bacterium]|jgi:glycine cleavage system H protein|nr:glycine cleavage system protein GcvH [Chloroflexota bacterium]
MATPTDAKYTKDHEWVRLEGDTAVVGITDYAQNELGDVVFVELPATGSPVKQGESFGVVESVKAASDLYAPLSGEVLATNEALTDSPDLVNKAPYGDGWMIKVRPSDAGELATLMDAGAYDEYVKGLH